MNPNGGKDNVLVALSSLSVKAQRAYNASLAVTRQENAEESDGPTPPWYVNGDYQAYIENNRDHYNKAIALCQQIKAYLEQIDDVPYSQKKPMAIAFAKKNGMSVENFYIKVRKYNEALKWAAIQEQKDGHSYYFYTALALCPEPREKNKFPSLSPQMKAFIKSKWFSKEFAQNQSTIQMLYELLEQEGEKKKWIIPTYDTVWRYVRWLMKTYNSEHYLAANGIREWKRNKMFKGRRDIKALAVNEVHMGDVHTFDCWVQITRPNGRVTAIKPCLAGWMDVRSHCLTGWVICDIPNQQIMKESLRRVIYEKANPAFPFRGVPKFLQIDNGKEYTAKDLTGRERSVRVSFDSDTEGFYRSIGIQDDWRSLPYQPWSKAEIERFFRTICDSFTRWLSSYVGSLTGSRTTSKIKKDVKKLLKSGALITLEEFSALFEKWLAERYHNRKHNGLKEQGETWKTPLEVYLNAERYEQPAPPMEYTIFSMMKADIATVRTTGISRFNQHYLAPELSAYIDQKVKIRYNPDDIATLHVYDIETNEKICEAVCQELLPYGAVSERTMAKVQKHVRMQNKQYSDVRANLRELLEAYGEEDAPILESDNVVIGPALKESEPDVVSLPRDEKYRKEKAAARQDRQNGSDKISSRQKKPPIENDYYQKRAIAALEKLKNFQ
jgi:transposase InsO family protein